MSKAHATYHPYPSYAAMKAAQYQPAVYPGALAQLTPPDRPNDAWAKELPPKPTYPVGNISQQRRPQK